jgi:hypothetical protein
MTYLGSPNSVSPCLLNTPKPTESATWHWTGVTRNMITLVKSDSFATTFKLIHFVFCLTTGPKSPAKRFLHIVRSRASAFKWEYPLLSLRLLIGTFLFYLVRIPWLLPVGSLVAQNSAVSASRCHSVVWVVTFVTSLFRSRGKDVGTSRLCDVCIWYGPYKQRPKLGLKFPYASVRNTKTFFRSVKRCWMEGSFVDRKRTRCRPHEEKLNENDYHRPSGWFDLHGERSTASFVRIIT